MPLAGADRKRERFLTLDESRNLVQAAFYIGARLSELTRLRVQDFNAVDGGIFITKSKSGLERTVYWDSDALAFFESVT